MRDVAADDQVAFRQVMSRFASGIVVVTGVDPLDERPVGMTCQSFSSLSLRPPMVLFSAANTSTTLPRLRRSEVVAVNVLSVGQTGVASAFARSGTDKFVGVATTPGPAGVPLLDAALVHVVGRIGATYPGGDHTVVLVDVTGLAVDDADVHPLVYYTSRYHRLVPAEPI